MQHYEQAADYFTGEESKTSANKCMLKVAQYAAQLEDYTKAIQIYEEVRIHIVDLIFFSILSLCFFVNWLGCHLIIGVCIGKISG